MNYYLIIIAALILAVILTLFKANAKRSVHADMQMLKLSDEDFIRTIVPFARTLRRVNKGNGGNLYSLLPAISKAERMLAQKVRSDRPILEFERWFFENIYLVRRFIFSNKRFVMRNLPHNEREVRIIKLARKIVSGSLLCLNQSRIEKAMQAAKNELTLTFSELMQFDAAIGFALCEQIYILAQRILFHNKMQYMASKSYVVKKYLCSDIYCRFALENEAIRDSVMQLMQTEGMNTQSIPLNYNTSLLETTQMAESLFTSFMGLKNFISKENALSYLNTDTILCKSQSYKDMSFDTRLSYHRIIEKLSESLNISEVMVALKLLEVSAHNNMDIGDILYDHYSELYRAIKTNKMPLLKHRSRLNNQRFFIGVVISLFVAVTAGVYLLSGNLLLTLLGAFPLLFAVDYLVNSFLSSTVRERVLPRMNYQKIPSDCKTLVVVSEFITSKEQAEEAVKRLKALCESNRDENLDFSLLVDMKPSESAVAQGDEEIKRVFNSLKDYPNCNVFIRKRVKIGKKYSGFERKRGAIMSLCRYLMSWNPNDFDLVLNDWQRPVYIVTLDADNTVLPGTFRDMVNIISHPYNQRYDLISAKSRYNLYSVNTLYGKSLLEDSGLAGYPVYSSYLYNLFGKDVFCGKGIFRLKNFFNKLEGIFPSQKILSHDIIEGSVLSTGCGGTIFEDAPKNFFADRDRKKRWIRGDIQLLPFTGKSWKNDEKEKYKSEISCFYKYLMIKNAFSSLLPFAIFVLAVVGAFYYLPALIYAGALVAFPYAVNLIKILRGMAGQIRTRYLVRKLVLLLLNFMEEVFMLPYYAVSNFLLFFTTINRMIARKNLLDWKTYRQSQNSSAKFAVEFLPAFIVLAVLSVASVFTLIPFYVSLFCLVSCLVQISRCIYSIPLKKHKVSADQTALLREIAEGTYKFFNASDEPDLIICDNIQVKPYKGFSDNTSPTNLGYSLLADISAYYLGFIDCETCLRKITMKLQKISRLKKWHGHLYNWYNVHTFQTVKNFVSSVDSGNFIACLYVLKAFLAEKGETELLGKVQSMIDDADFSYLYNYSKSLFYLGYDEDAGGYTGNYDLLASESRLLSLIFIARTGRTEHWWKLQRDYTRLCGNTLLSWSGTAFEYLMTDIFFVPPSCSLLATSSKNAAKIQSKTRFSGIWGVSESGYYELDEAFRYQYYAFGIRKLSLRNELDKPVISPYSSFLALRWQLKSAIKNIENLIAAGAYGDYGFYEALDARGKIRVVSSYMAHHQGMIISSIANILCSDKIAELFMSSPDIAGTLNILNELPSQTSYGSIKEQKPIKYNIITQGYYENISKIEQYPSCASLTNGNISVTFDSLGSNYASFRSYAIVPERSGENTGGYFYLTDGSNIFTTSFYPMRKNIDDYVFSYSNVEVTMENTAAKLKENICVADGLNMYVRKLKAWGSQLKDSMVHFYMPLALNTQDSFDSHPVFCKMFISSKYDAAEKCLIYKRTSLDKKGDFYFAVVIKGLTDIEVETNRFNFIGRNGDESAPKFLFTSGGGEYPSIGDVLEPCVGFRGRFENGEKECTLVFLTAETEEELFSMIKFLPEDAYKFASESARSKLRVSLLANKLSGELKHVPYPNSILNSVLDLGMKDVFINFSEGLKTILYRYSDSNGDNFVSLVHAVRDLQFINIKSKLVIVFEETYNNAVRKHIEGHLRKAFIRHYSLVEISDFKDYMAEFAFIVMDSDLNYTPNKPRGNLAREMRRQLTEPDYFMPYDLNEGLKCGAGTFLNDNYELTDKPLLPYSNVVCGEYGGFISTENGGGFTYFGNSRENKALCFDFDPVIDNPSEYIFVRSASDCVRINGGAEKWKKTVISKGMTRYYANFNDFSTLVSYYIVDGGKAKISEISVNFLGGAASIFYGVDPCLGWRAENSFIAVDSENQIMRINNLITGGKLFVKVIASKSEQSLYLNEKIPYYEISVTENTILYAILSDDYEYIKNIDEQHLISKKEIELVKFNQISNVNISTRIKSFDLLASFLPYQILSSRINGKCGYYQVGGAFGFRDQLQDCLAFLQSNPEIVKRHILDAAEHQYEEGDVMHWWHYPKWGLRTKISDDKLYLPYVTALYVESTRNFDILDEECSYLTSPPLEENQHTRYENPPYTDYKESLYKHCIKAIKSSLRFGEHKLLLLGGGDWNDGLDFAGSKGKGESVMLSMFCYETLIKFAEICENETKSKLLSIAADLKNAVEATFDGRQYGRIFTDDGKWMGYPSSKEYQLDLTAQSYAVLSGIADKTRQITALETAYDLVDEENGLIKLLHPPQDKSEYLGYISSYPKGVRENGGQYTHAAVWYITALAKVGKVEESFRLFQMINPIEKSIKNPVAYKAEPYVLAGDVYSNSDNLGRAGWTWYTGSAAWAYRLITEVYFGLKRKKDILIIDPRLPDALNGSQSEYRYMDSVYILKYEKTSGKSCIIIDGVKQSKSEIKLKDKTNLEVIVEAGQPEVLDIF